MKIALGCDHAGYKLKNILVSNLQQKGEKILNFGTDSLDSVDYPDFAHEVAKSIESGESDLGILICGSGNGIAMSANKHQGIRAAICWDVELAKLAREHNDANILVLPARFITEEEALEISNIFFETTFEGGRHERRRDKIARCN